jgi:hypothetical protein
VACIVAKGRRELVLPIGAKAARDIGRYPVCVPLTRALATRVYGRQEGPPDGERHLSDDQRPGQRDRASGLHPTSYGIRSRTTG